MEAKKSTFQGELSFQRSGCTAGLTVAATFWLLPDISTQFASMVICIYALLIYGAICLQKDVNISRHSSLTFSYKLQSHRSTNVEITHVFTQACSIFVQILQKYHAYLCIDAPHFYINLQVCTSFVDRFALHIYKTDTEVFIYF